MPGSSPAPLKRCGYLSIEEPFTGLFTQGMVCHETYRTVDGEWVQPADVIRGDVLRHRQSGVPLIAGRSEKMSKSRKNVIDPEDIIDTYGADTARWFMLSDSPPERDLDWTEAGIAGAWRFVNRLWRMVAASPRALAPIGAEAPAELGSNTKLKTIRQHTHRAIQAVTDDLETFHFNRAVARVYELVNVLSDFTTDDDSSAWVRREAFDATAQLIGPMMPHLAEELWEQLGHRASLADTAWPAPDPALLVADTVTVAVQVKGKMRGTVDLPQDAPQEDAEAAALALPAVAAALDGKPAQRVVFVPNRIINVVP